MLKSDSSSDHGSDKRREKEKKLENTIDQQKNIILKKSFQLKKLRKEKKDI